MRERFISSPLALSRRAPRFRRLPPSKRGVARIVGPRYPWRGPPQGRESRGGPLPLHSVKDDVGEWLSLIDEAKKDARDYHKTCERIRKRHRSARPHADALYRLHFGGLLLTRPDA